MWIVARGHPRHTHFSVWEIWSCGCVRSWVNGYMDKTNNQFEFRLCTAAAALPYSEPDFDLARHLSEEIR
jgi:hypothetical protein